MNPISNILVVVDPTSTIQPAVDKARVLAQRLSARVELYACETRAEREARFVNRATDSTIGDSMNLTTVLERLAAPLRAHGLDVVTEVGFAESYSEELVRKMSRTTAELVVKQTHHHSLLKRTLLTNTDWQLIRACPVPLLLTKAEVWHQPPTILAAVDPTHVNDKPALLDNCIMQMASAFSSKLQGELHVLHAFVPTAIIAAAVGVDPPSALALSESDLERERGSRLSEIAKMTDEFGVGPAHIHVELGGPMQCIPQAAKDLRADIVVMGALSRRGWKRAFIGSTAEDVLEDLASDALIIKPPDFAEALSGLCAPL
ncbi:MAG: universal stress protein [Povalibacter sp.]